jgi:hypothetical protein
LTVTVTVTLVPDRAMWLTTEPVDPQAGTGQKMTLPAFDGTVKT